MSMTANAGFTVTRSNLAGDQTTVVHAVDAASRQRQRDTMHAWGIFLVRWQLAAVMAFTRVGLPRMKIWGLLIEASGDVRALRIGRR